MSTPPPPDKKRNVGRDYESHASLSLDVDEDNKRRRRFYEEREERTRAEAASASSSEAVVDKPGGGAQSVLDYSKYSWIVIGKAGLPMDEQTKTYLTQTVQRMLNNDATTAQEWCDFLLEHDTYAKLIIYCNMSELERHRVRRDGLIRVARHNELPFILAMIPFDVMDVILRHLHEISRDVELDYRISEWQEVTQHIAEWHLQQPLDDDTKKALLREWNEFKNSPYFPLGRSLAGFFDSRSRGSAPRFDATVYWRPPRRDEVAFLLGKITQQERNRLRAVLAEDYTYHDDGIRQEFKEFQASRGPFFRSNVASSLHFQNDLPADVVGAIGPFLSLNLNPTAVSSSIRPPRSPAVRAAMQQVALWVQTTPTATPAEVQARYAAALLIV
jgi:hypothetical protein